MTEKGEEFPSEDLNEQMGEAIYFRFAPLRHELGVEVSLLGEGEEEHVGMLRKERAVHIRDKRNKLAQLFSLLNDGARDRRRSDPDLHLVEEGNLRLRRRKLLKKTSNERLYVTIP